MSSRTSRTQHPRKGSRPRITFGSRRKLVARRKRTSPMIGRSMPGFPQNKRVSLRFTTVVHLDAAAGGIATYNFSANGIVDPDLPSGVAKQPLGTKEWEAFYDHYVVTSSTITCDFMSATSNVPPMILGCYLADDATVPTTGQALIEQGLAKWQICSPGTNNGTFATKVTNRFTAKKFFNIKDIKDNFSRLGSTFATNPTEMAQYHLFVSALDISVNPPSIAVQVVIDYDVLFSEPKSLTPSVGPT